MIFYKENRRIYVFYLFQDADASEIKVQVCVYAFDLLYLNGESLVTQPFRRRRELLHQSFEEIEGEFVYAKSKILSDTEEIAEFLDESVKGILFRIVQSSLFWILVLDDGQ